MRKRTIVIGIVLVAIAAVAGYFIYTNNTRASAAATQTQQTATVTRGNLIATVNSAGPVAARAQVALNFGTAGTVKQIYVKVGDVVKQGDVLAELDSTDLQFSMANAQIAFNQQLIQYQKAKAGPTADELAAARANVESVQANYDLAVRKANLNDDQLVQLRNSLEKSAIALQKAQSDYDKAVSERKSDLTAQAIALQQAKLDYESAQANYNIQVANINDSNVRSAASSLLSTKANLAKLENSPTQQDLQIAEAQMEQARLNLAQAQYKMRNMQIVAPFNGTVTQVNIDNFYAVAGNTAAIQLSDLSKLQITVNMAEVDIGKVKVGQDVNITFDALPDRPQLTGKVEQVALVAVTQQGVVNYPVVIVLDSPDTSVIKTGMTANVAIVVDKRENVLLVPNRALRNQGRQKVAQVQQPNLNTPLQTVVQTGLQSDTHSEVLSGLKEGDVVVITTTTRTTTPTGGFGPAGGGPPPGNVIIR
jgi:RND family efflux transporter MFP subunit